MFRAPIVVMAFNRAKYLDRVLATLKLQVNARIDDREIFLFQDGAINRFSGKVYADQCETDLVAKTFRQHFPDGRQFLSSDNLGTAFNFDRAERYVFEEIGSAAAIFLEDDLVLSPFYVSILDRLIDVALNDNRIGYVSAIGDHRLSIHEQHAGRSGLQRLVQNWAFGLTKYQWTKNKELVGQYLDIIRNLDYRQRPHAKIFDFYSKLGVARVQSSQDRMKLVATTLTGGLRINTKASFGKYIGEVGVHSDSEMFRISGFSEAEMYPVPVFQFEAVTSAFYDATLASQRADIVDVVPTVKFDEVVSFVSGQRGESALEAGFHPPEQWGVWSANEVSALRFTVSPEITVSVATLTFWIRHYRKPNDVSVKLGISINGVACPSLTWDGDFREIQINVPQPVKGGDRVEVEFRSNYVQSPSSFGVDDQRDLGVGLGSMTLIRR